MIGNPVLKEVPNYRKHTIASCPNLKYLDKRRTRKDERRLAEAWKRGGRKAIREEREKMKAEKAEVEERKRRQFQEMIAAGRSEDDSDEEEDITNPLYESTMSLEEEKLDLADTVIDKEKEMDVDDTLMNKIV